MSPVRESYLSLLQPLDMIFACTHTHTHTHALDMSPLDMKTLGAVVS